MTRMELNKLGNDLAEAEAKVQELKSQIIQGLGLRSLIRYGSLVKLDWQKIKRGSAPWVDEQINEMLKQGEKY